MKLSHLKLLLKELKTIHFQLPNKELVPNHFHVTEVGKITKHFIDCGGTERKEAIVNLQLYNANDYDHRLHPEKLLKIIELSEKALKLADLEIEVEYQADTIGKFGLEFDGKHFLLTNKQTNCLAADNCNIQVEDSKTKTSEFQTESKIGCAPGSGCC